jgi:hypothetical protein
VERESDAKSKIGEELSAAGPRPRAIIIDVGSVAASATTTTITTTTTRALALLSLIHLEGTALEVLAVQRLHRPGCIGVRHFDEAEATRPAGLAVIDES